MGNQDKHAVRSDAEGNEARPYAPPELRALGTLRETTLGTVYSGGSDGMGKKEKR